MNDNRGQRFGATLYLPALHANISKVRHGSVRTLGSMVICLEDAIRDDQILEALDALRGHLATHDPTLDVPNVYVRPRDVAMLERVLRYPGIEAIRGFVIPKANADTLPDWINVLRGGRHAVMPTLETWHAFDAREVYRMRDQTLTLGVDVDVVRIGGNDLLSTIGARRSSRRTLYDGPLGPVVSSIAGAFAGTGILLSSPVFEHFSDHRLLAEEIERDVEHGIFNKTAIHPDQVETINKSLSPTAMEVAEAKAILEEGADAVFGRAGSMCEPKTHSAWAHMVIARHRQLGLRDDLPSAVAV